MSDLTADVQELRKWLNEEPNRPVDRQALARVLASNVQPKVMAPSAADIFASLRAAGECWPTGVSYADAELIARASLRAVQAPAVEEQTECETWRTLCEFLLEADEPMAFLRAWNEGNFDACKREWPEAPANVYPASAHATQAQPVAWRWEHYAPSGEVFNSGISETCVQPTQHAYIHEGSGEWVGTRVTPLYAAHQY